MKFYKSKHSVVGEGVEATVLYHKDNGDELVCVREGFEVFEQENADAKEQTVEQTDKILEKETLTIVVPSKAEVRKQKQLSKEEIRTEIESEETPTADIAVIEEKDEAGNSVQKLTYFEKREIKSVEDFLKAQEEQRKELEHVALADELEEEAKTETEEKL